jgi:hypothetical protein
MMTHRALALPWEFNDPIDSLWDELSAEAQEAAGEVRALQDVLSWASSHEHTFHGRFTVNDFREMVPVEVAGRWDKGEDWEFLAFYPTVLRRILKAEGYEPEAILHGWRERGWLKAQKGSYLWPVRVGARMDKMNFILRAAFQSESAEEAEEA